jgi:iron complex outermembrane receptor protein
MGKVSATTNSGPWSTSFQAEGIKSDGYRVNNSLEQQNAVGDIRYTTADFTAYFDVSGDNQHLGFPGPRTVDPSIGLNELATDRKGTNTPFDYGNKQDANATGGFTKTLWNGAELIVDGGYRNKQTQAAFLDGTDPFFFSYVNATLQTWSLTPRLSIKNSMFGLPSTILTGVDFYDYNYVQDHRNVQGAIPIHTYDLSHRFVLWRPDSGHPCYRDRPVEQRSRLRRGILLRHAGGAAGHHPSQSRAAYRHRTPFQ